MLLMLRLFILLFPLSISYARVAYEYQRPVWAMGMGGVYTPFPRVGDMPTVNAAYLRYVKSVGIEIMNLGLGAPGLSTIEEFQDLGTPNDISDINNYLGRPIWSGLNARATLALPYFGLSFYNNYSLYTYFSNPLMPEWNIDYRKDDGFTGAFAFPLGPELSMGVSLKKIIRKGGPLTLDFDTIDEFIQNEDLDALLDEFSNKGVGHGMDVSLLYKPEKATLPIATLVWKDIGYTTFQKTRGTRAPPHIADNLTLGLGYEYEGLIGGKLGFEYRHITTSNIQLGNKLHFGGELSLPLIDIRAGVSQGYMTYGVGLDLYVFRLEASQYTVEMGEYPGQSPEPRLEIGLMLDLTVDADFNISSSSADSAKKRRGLKERR